MLYSNYYVNLFLPERQVNIIDHNLMYYTIITFHL